MTSEVDGLKTNEFLRRRKLRLQQVREQSKDIAKKVRQRAKVEKLRQVVELDSKKQREFLHRQERLVQQLEQYCAKGVENIGASHRNASEARIQDDHRDKVDPSKQRGKDAAAELRKKRQQILDTQKKLLDRKLQAREVANDISREKSASVVNKLQSKPAGKSKEDTQSKSSDNDKNINTENGDGEHKNINRNEMATQCVLEEMLNEWEPNIPTLALPKDDNSVKESNNNNVDSKSDKNKVLDLFALSDEMPSSLRGGLTTQEERVPVRPSLTLVSEYLQNRVLRLRESDTARSSNKMEDLQSLKQTILRTRTSKEAKGNGEKTLKSNTQSTVPKRNSVTIYNHSTRDTKDIPCNDERLVLRDLQADDDAYSQAMKESACSHHVDKDKKIQDIRSKVAMTKQNVEKEYRDTISFLNALPKNKGDKPIKTAFMNEQRQQMQKDYRQQKLQQEYRKIEKECSKHNCKKKSQKKLGSPTKDKGDVFEKSDFQYSWMPVPEGDGNLAIHTIPTSVKEAKSGNSVKFSKVDSYHEYRSRHKHTPPTKDTGRDTPKTYVEAVVDQTSSDDSESASSDTSSDNIRLEKKDKTENNTEKLSDAERIVIYKILDSKVNKRKKNSNLMKEIAKSLSLIGKQNKDDRNDQTKQNCSKNTDSGVNRVSFEHLDEGVYQAVNEKGDNMSAMYFNNREGETIVAAPKEQQFGPQCTHTKKLNKEDQHDTVTASTSQQWQSGEKLSTPRSHSPCVAAFKCGCKRAPSKQKDIQSTITSTSSFKTATNEDAGFIKLMGDVGEEASKFYIGASGFIKDNDYEVVIQLRKKGDDREISNANRDDKINKSEEKPSSVDKVCAVTNGASVTKTCAEETNETSKNKIELVATVSSTKEVPPETEKSDISHDVVVNVTTEVLTNPLKQTLNGVNGSQRSTDNVIIDEPITVAEKGVSTSFQDTYVVPPNNPNSDPMPRPATSTYTQTSMSSPNHRPVFFHMSSSTSTAYMSPPDVILPKFLIQDYQLTDEEYPINDMGRFEHTENHDNTDEYDCRCKKCMRSVKLTKRQHIGTSIPQCRKDKFQNAKTPPNSTRSGPSEKGEHNIYINEENSRRNFAPLLINKRSKCKCRKCENHNSARNDDILASRTKSHNLTTAKHSSRNQPMCVSSSAASFNKERQASKRSKPKLKPVIKQYVDQLLVLNRDSLKAVQVIDQDCSSVTTPGSSIIEVPNNADRLQPTLENKLSLQKIKVMLRQKIIDDTEKKEHVIKNQNTEACLKKQSNIKVPRWSRKKTGHKVKSLNISKNLTNVKNTREMKPPQFKIGSSSSTKGECLKEKISSIPSRNKVRSKSSPTPRLIQNSETTDKSTNSDLPHIKRKDRDEFNPKLYKTKRFHDRKSEGKRIGGSSNRATSTSTDSEGNPSLLKPKNVDIPMSISTQTSINVDSETNFMKLAEDKLQNMEKIADLTEKCTQRLSNLAKVLEEVRKNKTMAYSQISTSDVTSDSDQKSDKNLNRIKTPTLEPSNIVSKKCKSNSPLLGDTLKADTLKENDNNALDSTGYIPFLSDIPKPTFKNVNSEFDTDSSSSSSNKSSSALPLHGYLDPAPKTRGKPPPALSRIHLKNEQDLIVPHELSTVVEVDSPMSVKMKSSRNDTKLDIPDTSYRNNNNITKDISTNPLVEFNNNDAKNNPDLLDNNGKLSNEPLKMFGTESSDNSTKVQMIDIRQFNEIMLKPFFSIQEYAKQCNVAVLDDGSNLDDNIIVKDDQINDELSSLHSEASLPDVISELLKRNIISEPFRFDTGSNTNSTTVSSESTISVLALSKTRQVKNKLGVIMQSKENTAETSDTLSISSNPDLENAFKKLGMGWASSTLKKTKERLALSSSSNTSSSSVSQFKVRSFNPEVPAVVTDTVSSVLNYSKKPQERIAVDTSKHAEQQTSLSNSMTVKEFLTNELAKKITFNNKSRNDTEEFVSLFETKMPEEMKHSSRMVREENSIDNSMRSGNRARTSTPVQLFKSMTYHSSSSSNVSNGLFSNADDLSSVKVTSNSMKHSTSDKDDLIIPNFSLRMKKGSSENSKSD